jgi:hypothetical protein
LRGRETGLVSLKGNTMPIFTIRQIVLTHAPSFGLLCAGCGDVRWSPEHVLNKLEEVGHDTYAPHE